MDDVGRDAIFFNYTKYNAEYWQEQALKLPADQLFSVLTKSCFTLPLPPHFKPAGSGFQAQQTNALGAEEGIHIGDQRGTSCWLQYCVYTIIQVYVL